MNQPTSTLRHFLRVVLLSLVVVLPAFAAPPPEIKVEVDAREISRSLLHARLEIPAAAGDFVVCYPKWVPGVHAPSGPVQNLAGLRFETVAGAPITWRRDDEQMHRFHLTVPAGVDRVVARLDYICNQPVPNSSGVDCFGNSKLGVINWNTVLLYPEGASIDTATAAVRLALPDGWKYGTSLTAAKSEGALTAFQPTTLRRVVDSPLICGENFRTIELAGKGTPPNSPPGFLHLTSEAASAIAIDDKLIAQYRKLYAEGLTLFGGARFESYHFLVVCSDTVPHNGLEHLASSFNAVNERALIDDKKRKVGPVYLLPHEFTHSWCGKFRRPAGMVTTSFHQPERTGLLWVYEGLTQYLGEVLAVRSGLLSFDEHLPAFASKLDGLMRTDGRKWRSLEDTAISSWMNRVRSTSWHELRRGQDYYNEGLVVWLEADALIREKTSGRKSLDDFCKKFFAADREKMPEVVGYEQKEITGLLRELADEDWEKFFAERISQTHEALGLDFLPKTVGYRLQYSAKPSEYLTDRDKEGKQVAATASLGLIAAEDGKISTVIPGSPADKAGLAAGMTIAGVNGRKFSAQRLKDAVADSTTLRKVEMLILEGDVFRSVALAYADGPKYLELTRTPDHADTLAAILKPVTKEEKN
ncbi:MAG: PDZ domain-containing protein [Chthoniobacteraceae bacterium]